MRFMMAEAAGAEYRSCKSLSDARETPGAVAVMEGDWGGQIYVTCPVRDIRCDADTLLKLLRDIDALEWDEPDGAGLYFEVPASGSGIAGGMGGGSIRDGVWVHPRLEPHRARIEAVISGAAGSLSETGGTSKA